MYRMLEYNVAIRQDPEPEKVGSLILTNDRVEENKHKRNIGTLVAAGPMAFAFDDWPEGVKKPEPGDTVIYSKHAGTFVEIDGVELRIMKDKDLLAVVNG